MGNRITCCRCGKPFKNYSDVDLHVYNEFVSIHDNFEPIHHLEACGKWFCFGCFKTFRNYEDYWRHFT